MCFSGSSYFHHNDDDVQPLETITMDNSPLHNSSVKNQILVNIAEVQNSSSTIEQYSSYNMNGLWTFVCHFNNCGRLFKSKQKVQRHLLTHTGEKPYACRFCDYRTARKDQVKIHEYGKHYDDLKALSASWRHRKDVQICYS